MSAPNDTVAGALRDGFISRQLSPSLYFNPTGKPVAVKVARPVWSGGKVARPYLSLSSKSRLFTALDEVFQPHKIFQWKSGAIQYLRPKFCDVGVRG